MSGQPKKLGKYQVKSVLGQGAMGVVYECFDPDIERTVAIKILHSHLCNTDEGESFKKRFRREAQAAARCNHPNIVEIYELGNDGGRDYIAMEFVQGEELKYFLGSGHQFTHAESLHVVAEVLKALSAAHEHGVIHRDIKPANIILLDNGTVKVADFGVAHIQQSDLTVVGNMVGTPTYMCPEGLKGDAVDLRADIYSAGMVLLEMLTGRKPLPQELYSQSASTFVDAVFAKHNGQPLLPAMQSLLRSALAEDRNKRFSTAKEFLSELEQVASAIPTEGVDRSPVEMLSETVVSQRPLVKPVEDVVWDRKLLHELELGLASFIGPIAALMVKQSSMVTRTPEALLDSVAGHLDDPAERTSFLLQARRIIAQSCGGDLSGIKACSGQECLADTLSPEQLEGLTRKLAYHIGPFARYLVTRGAHENHDVNTLCRQLAENIPDGSEREAFIDAVDSDLLPKGKAP